VPVILTDDQAWDWVLRALEVPGGQVMDFRLLMLTRVE